jgi:hypothetical protein
MSDKLAIGRLGGAAIVGLAMTLGTAASEELEAAALDQSTAPVNSCSIDEMLSMTKGIPTVS